MGSFRDRDGGIGDSEYIIILKNLITVLSGLIQPSSKIYTCRLLLDKGYQNIFLF